MSNSKPNKTLSLGTLRHAIKTKDKSPDATGTIYIKRDLLLRLYRELNQSNGDGVLGYLAGWLKEDGDGKYMTVQLSAKFEKPEYRSDSPFFAFHWRGDRRRLATCPCWAVAQSLLACRSRSIFESAIQSSISSGYPRIILDMRKLTFISSVGLRLISITAKQTTIAQGGLAIFGLRSDQNEVFEICGMKDIVAIASGEAEARSMLGAWGFRRRNRWLRHEDDNGKHDDSAVGQCQRNLPTALGDCHWSARYKIP
jgi:anti-anti-sigma factor